MSSCTVLRTLALLSLAIRVVTAATCEVAGGTSDDGPAIKAALATCNNGGTVLLDKTYTIGTVLETTSLSNVAIELTGTIILSPGMLTVFELIENFERIFV
jgi:galacturan 1,4-alpha-galacturonidase